MIVYTYQWGRTLYVRGYRDDREETGWAYRSMLYEQDPNFVPSIESEVIRALFPKWDFGSRSQHSLGGMVFYLIDRDTAIMKYVMGS